MDSRRLKCAVLVVVALGLLARLYWFAYNPSLWNDEASLANNVIKYDLTKIAVTPLDDLQAAPPGYLLIEKICGQLGGYSELSLRVVSLLCGLAALLLFVNLSNRLLAGWGRLAAVALFSLSGPLIYHSGEVKQYQTEVLMAVVLIWLAVRLAEKTSLIQAVLTGGVAALCVWFANSAVFVLAGAFGALVVNFLLSRQPRQARYAGLTLALGGGSFLIYYVFLLRHNPNVAALKATWADHFAPLPISGSGLVWYVRTLFFAMVNPLGLSLDLDLPFLPHSTAFKYLTAFCYPGLVLFGVGVVDFWRKDRRAGSIALGGIVVTVVASLLHQFPLNERLIAFLSPMVFLALGKAAERAGVEMGWSRTATRLLLGWLAVYTLINFSQKALDPRYFGGNEKYSQMREAIHFIKDHKQPNDAVFIMWSAGRFYDYYDFRENLGWPVIKGADPRLDAHSEDDVTAQITQQVSAAQKVHPRVWFLLQDDLSPVTYVDARHVKHETLTPTGVVYENVLHGMVKSNPDKDFVGHAASAILVNSGN